jgi:hypothetical protein
VHGCIDRIRRKLMCGDVAPGLHALAAEVSMQERLVQLPELGLFGFTRGMIGFGAGLFASELFSRKRRKTIATVLVAVGALSTIPLGIRILRRRPERVFDGRSRREPVMTH